MEIKSNLDNEKIIEILKENYNIVPNSIEEINRGTANIFKIETGNKSYILKEFNKNRTEDLVKKEINIINFLRKKDIKVPKYMKTIKGNFYIVYDGRIIIVQEYIDGYTMENNTGSHEKVIESANILGKIVKALEDYPDLSEENIIEKNFSKESIISKIEKMEQLEKKVKEDNKYKEKITQDLNYKIMILKTFLENFDFNIIRKMTIINTHGDFSVQQLIYNDKKGTTVIDFETAKKMPIVWEIIRSYSYIDKDAKNGKLNIDTLVEYFKEFDKYIKLNKYDLKYAPHVYLLQLAGSTFGYKEYIDDYKQRKLLKFGFFRTNLCEFLYKNLDVISLRLKIK